ncbi:MAG: hypothetical protein AB7G47_10390 [Mycolicibacterium sp.]|uniref:hypothetical protein n=1 Tax=Mycolicibacterium sp. TaxID=2320850 RepID=UPI003D11A845
MRTALGTIGIATERGFFALRVTPRNVRQALAQRRPRRFAIAAGFAVLLLYLLAIGDIAVSGSRKTGFGPNVQVAFDNLLQARAAYLFEPVLAITAGAHLTLFVSPVNLVLGAAVAALAAANVAVSVHVAQTMACSRTRFGPLLGVLPSLGIGVACCAPTVLIALGAGMGAALLPAVLMLRPIFYPLTIGALVIALVWQSFRGVQPRVSGERTLSAL